MRRLLLFVLSVAAVTVIEPQSTRPAMAARAAGPPAPARFVSVAGADANPGTQIAPWRTVEHAARVAGPGSTVNIEAGDYPELVSLSTPGAAGAPVTFRNSGADPVTVHGFAVGASHVAISGLTVSRAEGPCISIGAGLTDITVAGDTITRCGGDGIRFDRPGGPPSTHQTSGVTIARNSIRGVGTSDPNGSDLVIRGDHVMVQGNDISGTPNDAIDMWGDSLTFRANTIHDIGNTVGNHDDAFQTWTGLNDGAEGNPVTNLLIEQNTVRDITGGNAHGLMSEGPGHHDWTIRDNVFRNIGDQAIIFAKPGGAGIRNLTVSNNTFVAAGSVNTIEFNAATTGRMADNIFYNCAGWGGGVPFSIGAAAAVVHGYDLAGGTTRSLTEPGAVNADPGFVDRAGDLRLARGSRAIDAGDNGRIVSPVRPYDMNGAPVVGVVDIGAYEYPG